MGSNVQLAMPVFGAWPLAAFVAKHKGKAPAMDHSNLFHAALSKVLDIAKNGTRTRAAWNEVIEIADAALATAKYLDQQSPNVVQSRKYK